LKAWTALSGSWSTRGGDIYVSLANSNNIVKEYSSTGTLLDTWGSDARDSCSAPMGITIDRSGQDFITETDYSASRIQVRDNQPGEIVGTIGS
jgi:hypothetical protein